MLPPPKSSRYFAMRSLLRPGPPRNRHLPRRSTAPDIDTDGECVAHCDGRGPWLTVPPQPVYGPLRGGIRMTAGTTWTTHIKASPEAVFNVLGDIQNHSAWSDKTFTAT